MRELPDAMALWFEKDGVFLSRLLCVATSWCFSKGGSSMKFIGKKWKETCVKDLKIIDQSLQRLEITPGDKSAITNHHAFVWV